MRYYSIKNKRKVWRYTYGKKVLARRFMAMSEIDFILMMGTITGENIAHSDRGRVEKAIAIANNTINTLKAVNRVLDIYGGH